VSEEKPMTAGELKGMRLAHGKFVICNLMKLLNEHTGIKYETLDDRIGFCVELVECIKQVQIELENFKDSHYCENSNKDRYKEIIDDVEYMVFSVRTYNCLKYENIKNMWQLVSKTENEMLRVPNFGRKSLREIKEYIEPLGLRFGMSEKDFYGWLKQKAIG